MKAFAFPWWVLPAVSQWWVYSWLWSIGIRLAIGWTDICFVLVGLWWEQICLVSERLSGCFLQKKVRKLVPARRSWTSFIQASRQDRTLQRRNKSLRPQKSRSWSWCSGQGWLPSDTFRDCRCMIYFSSSNIINTVNHPCLLYSDTSSYASCIQISYYSSPINYK